MKPVNLNSLNAWRRKSSRSKRDEPPNSKEDGSLPPEFPNNELVDSFSVSDSCSDSREEVYSAFEITVRMVRPTKLGRVGILTSRNNRSVKWQELVTK